MAFMGILVVLGIMSAALITFLFWVAILMLGGLLEGFLVAHMGKVLARDASLVAKRPRFIKACKILGRATSVVCIAAILSTIILVVSSFTQTSNAGSNAQGAVLGTVFLALVLLGFLLFVTMGVLLIGIFRHNRQAGQPPAGKALSVACLVLGIVTLAAGVISVLTVALVLLLFT